MQEHHAPTEPEPTPSSRSTNGKPLETPSQLGNLSDLLQEMRVLLQSAALLTGFLVVLPFYQGFAHEDSIERAIYLATFACSLCALIIFSAPAAQHRLEWPLRNRGRFKRFATRMMILGLVPLSLALVLTTQLVVSQILDTRAGLVSAALVLVLVVTLWWVVPLEARGSQDS